MAIIVAVVVGFVIGFLWHGPLFGKAWAREMGMNTSGEKPDMMKPMLMNIVGLFLVAYVLYHGLVMGNAFFNTSGASAGMMGAFWYWLGFFVPVFINTVAWEKRSWKLFFINTGYWLVTLLAMSATLSHWM